MAAKSIPVDDILGVAEILALAGISNRRVLREWRDRDRHPFPAPARVLACGEVWDGRAVVRWLESHR